MTIPSSSDASVSSAPRLSSIPPLSPLNLSLASTQQSALLSSHSSTPTRPQAFQGSTLDPSASITDQLREAMSSATPARRPLPVPPSSPPLNAQPAYYPPQQSQQQPTGCYLSPPPSSPPYSSADYYASSPSRGPDLYARYPPASPQTPPRPAYFSTAKGSAFIHKGFADIMSLVATPSQSGTGVGSRFFGAGRGRNRDEDELLRTARAYEGYAGTGLPVGREAPTVGRGRGAGGPMTPPKSPAAKSKKRVSIDMVGKPQGFVHLVHASDAEQASALLHAWPSDKIVDPNWAKPIKTAVRARAAQAQAEAVAQIQAAMHPSESDPGGRVLQVVNGLPSTISTTTVGTSVPSPASYFDQNHPPSPARSGLPATHSPLANVVEQPLRSPIKQQQPQQRYAQEDTITTAPEPAPGDATPLRLDTDQTAVFRERGHRGLIQGSPTSNLPDEPEPVPYPHPLPAPSLAALDKAVSTKIYFENLYWSLLKAPRARETRRLALEGELARLGLSEQEKGRVRDAWRAAETENLRECRRRVGPEAFIKLKTIGHGAFGVVWLAREKSNNNLYAIKEVRKADMLKKGQEGHIRAERDLFSSAASAGSRWIVRLNYAFQDVDHLYLVMEFMGGGDLLNLLIERDVFEEDFARFYVAEMVLAISEAHKLGYIHRDIKPDNFLFDRHGHLKLSDFGLATDFHWSHDGGYYEKQRKDLLRKHGIDLEAATAMSKPTTRKMTRAEVEGIMGPDNGEPNRGLLTWREKNRKKLAYSLVGTNNYMAPEVLRGLGYDQSCDWWSLGIIAYECLYGFPPFVSQSRHLTRQKILSWKTSLRFPPRPRISREAQDFLTGLICEREDRLGSTSTASVSRPNSLILNARRSGFQNPGAPVVRDGSEELKSHPFFRTIDFSTIHLQTPPFQPNLSTPTDTRHFDDDIAPEPLAPPGGANPDAARDPMLRDKEHGPRILDARKAAAFKGFTYKSPRAVVDSRTGVINLMSPANNAGTRRGRKPAGLDAAVDEPRGRSPERNIDDPTVGSRLRALSV